MNAVKTWFHDVATGVWTVLVGMKITIKCLFRKPVTMQYPEEAWVVPDGYRGYHEYDLEACIGCFLCVKACPVECIAMDVKRKGRDLTVTKYEIDYTKCLFCNLCCEPCPTNCINMGKAFDFSTWDKGELVVDFVQVGRIIPQAKYSPAKLDRAPGYYEKEAFVGVMDDPRYIANPTGKYSATGPSPAYFEPPKKDEKKDDKAAAPAASAAAPAATATAPPPKAEGTDPAPGGGAAAS